MKTRYICGVLAGLVVAAVGCGEVIITEGDGGSLFDNGGAPGSGGSTSQGGSAGANNAGSPMTETGGAGGMMTDAGIEPLMCDPDDPELSTCDMCVQTSCCDEIIGCSESVECSGDFVDENDPIMGEYGCIQEEVQRLFDEEEAANPGSGFVDDLSVEEAMEICRLDAEGLLLAQETTDLLTCIVGEDGNGPCAPDCFEGYIAPGQ